MSIFNSKGGQSMYPDYTPMQSPQFGPPSGLLTLLQTMMTSGKTTKGKTGSGKDSGGGESLLPGTEGETKWMIGKNSELNALSQSLVDKAITTFKKQGGSAERFLSSDEGKEIVQGLKQVGMIQNALEGYKPILNENVTELKNAQKGYEDKQVLGETALIEKPGGIFVPIGVNEDKTLKKYNEYFVEQQEQTPDKNTGPVLRTFLSSPDFKGKFNNRMQSWFKDAQGSMREGPGTPKVVNENGEVIRGDNPNDLVRYLVTSTGGGNYTAVHNVSKVLSDNLTREERIDAWTEFYDKLAAGEMPIILENEKGNKERVKQYKEQVKTLSDFVASGFDIKKVGADKIQDIFVDYVGNRAKGLEQTYIRSQYSQSMNKTFDIGTGEGKVENIPLNDWDFFSLPNNIKDYYKPIEGGSNYIQYSNGLKLYNAKEGSLIYYLQQNPELYKKYENALSRIEWDKGVQIIKHPFNTTSDLFKSGAITKEGLVLDPSQLASMNGEVTAINNFAILPERYKVDGRMINDVPLQNGQPKNYENFVGLDIAVKNRKNIWSITKPGEKDGNVEYNQDLSKAEAEAVGWVKSEVDGKWHNTIWIPKSHAQGIEDYSNSERGLLQQKGNQVRSIEQQAQEELNRKLNGK